MKLRYLFLAAVLFAGACSRPSETFSTGIIPVPQHVNWGEGTFRMPRTLTYVTDLEGQEKADLAAWMERSVAGRFFPVPFVEALEGDIPALRLRIADKGAPESYRLDVVRDSMTITAPDAAGLFYGLQSLAQLAEHTGQRIPAVTIEDAPRFAYRGFMLDVSRHFRDKELKQTATRSAGPLQAQPVSLASDRRCWLAYRDQEISRVDGFCGLEALFLLYGVVLRRPALLSSG